ncbi:hypothetical protein PoB_000564900 [Plakobranchus ocellatus]|uniref:Uncharacterized protein n=1 Tax=Plakobranchus ocellatus TaxID=259542 RepID=A0AAV3YA34_9GAST|nr:hypothetical protein PoB_000564900 [Plakobranchus ocellatus]
MSGHADNVDIHCPLNLRQRSQAERPPFQFHRKHKYLDLTIGLARRTASGINTNVDSLRWYKRYLCSQRIRCNLRQDRFATVQYE